MVDAGTKCNEFFSEDFLETFEACLGPFQTAMSEFHLQ